MGYISNVAMIRNTVEDKTTEAVGAFLSGGDSQSNNNHHNRMIAKEHSMQVVEVEDIKNEDSELAYSMYSSQTYNAKTNIRNMEHVNNNTAPFHRPSTGHNSADCENLDGGPPIQNVHQLNNGTSEEDDHGVIEEKTEERKGKRGEQTSYKTMLNLFIMLSIWIICCNINVSLELSKIVVVNVYTINF